MLKGHVFDLQTFTSGAFALFIDKFLDGRCGVAKGCELSNSTNSVTIGEGYFVVRGRLLQIISNETVESITADGFYSLVCEVDLSKTNTQDQLNQAEIKVISNSASYPTLTQQDITGDGSLYQYEFARFKVENGSVTSFTDKRSFVDLTNIFNQIESEAQVVLDQIEEALGEVLDGSIYALKSELADYALKSELDDYAQKTELANYATKSQLDNYALESDLDDYVLQANIGTIASKNYRYGTAAPSGGSNGDIYDQYFN